MREHKENILILGGGLQGLSVARSLYESSFNIICIAKEDEVIRHSRYIHGFLPAPSQIDLNYVYSIIARYDISVLIPMSDIYAEFLSINKIELEKKTDARCAVADYHVFKEGYRKSSLLSLCEKYDIPHPRTSSISINNFREAANYVGFPALIKPDYSVGARGIVRVDNLDELKTKLYCVEKEYGPCSLQEFIESKNGPYYNVILYRNRNGEIIAHSILEIQRYFPITGGSSCYGMTIENQQLLTICTDLLEELNWWGVADFDVLVNSAGEYKIIELNPRVPASIRAAAVSGINFPEIMVNDCLEREQHKYKYEIGKSLRYLGLDIMWFLKSPRRFKVSPSWFKFFGKNLYYQDSGGNGIYVMICSFILGLKKVLKPSFRESKKGFN